MTTLFLFILTFLKSIIFNPTVEKVAIAGVMTIMAKSGSAQVSQPNGGIYSPERTYIFWINKSGTQVLNSPIYAVLDSFKNWNWRTGSMFFDSTLYMPGNSRMLVLGPNNKLGWDSIADVEGITQSDGDQRYFMRSDSVPNGQVMTKTAAMDAIQAIDDNVDTRQSYTDTATYDATKSWVSGNYYPSSNPAGYLNEITPAIISTALSYVPYNSSNPAGYISGIDSYTVVTALGYVPLGTTYLTWHNINDKPSFSSVATSGNYNDLFNRPDLSNYATTAMLYTQMLPMINYYALTDSLSLYATKAELTSGLTVKFNSSDFVSSFNTNFSAKNTTDLSEGTNLYWTSGRFNTAFGAKSTTDLTEGSNLYFTNSRARSAVSANTPLVYNSTTGLFSIQQASGAQSGFLSSSDYLVFNNKQNSLVSGTSIKTVNGNTLLGSGDLVVAGTTYTAGTGININGSNVVSNTAPDQTVSITSGNTDMSVTGTYPNFTLTNYIPAPSTPSRALNSNYTISSTKAAWVSYSVTCQVTNPLLAGNSSASCFLEYSTNGGGAWTTVSQTGNLSSVALTVTVSITNSQTTVLTGFIPANALVRLRSTTAGTANVSIVQQQETY